MDSRETPLLPATRISSVSLDYGTDAHECAEDSVEVSERGMKIRCRWCFEIGTQIVVSFVCPKSFPGYGRLTAEGIVVWCEQCADFPKTYESTLLFLELPDELKQGLRELSFLLDPK